MVWQPALPIRILNWSCAQTKSNLIGAFLIPLLLVLVGIGIFLITDGIERITIGIWLSMAWATITLALFKYFEYRIQDTFDRLKGVISDCEGAMNPARVSTYKFTNNKRYYFVSGLVLLVVMPNMYSTYIINYDSILLQSWATLFFVYIASVGGYGMAATVAFDSYIRDLIDKIPFEPQPFHPDLFMGLKPLGNFVVTAALLVSSASLLFPLIFETVIGGPWARYLAYLIFLTILSSILAIFFLPLLTVKNKIEAEKYRVLTDFEREYQDRLVSFKLAPTVKEKYVLQMMLVEKEKLREIRLFPFETRMIFQVVVSILLPIVMLLLQIYLKK